MSNNWLTNISVQLLEIGALGKKYLVDQCVYELLAHRRIRVVCSVMSHCHYFNVSCVRNFISRVLTLKKSIYFILKVQILHVLYIHDLPVYCWEHTRSTCPRVGSVSSSAADMIDAHIYGCSLFCKRVRVEGQSFWISNLHYPRGAYTFDQSFIYFIFFFIRLSFIIIFFIHIY